MGLSKNRYRTLVIFMIIGLQLTLLGIVSLIGEIGGLLALVYLGPLVTFSATTYALLDVSSAPHSTQQY